MGRLSDEQRFEKALSTDGFVIAKSAARHVRNLSLHDSLRLTLLAARSEPRSYPGYTRRWLTRWMEQASPDPARIAAVATLLAQAPHARQAQPKATTELAEIIARSAGVDPIGAVPGMPLAAVGTSR